jgi:hypothetical protein
MTEQPLAAAQGDPRFEAMGGKRVTPEMRLPGLRHLGGVAGFCTQAGDAGAGERRGETVTGKEPGWERLELPGAPQERQQGGGEHHAALPCALALAHVAPQALGVHVGALELTECGDPEAGRIPRGADHPMLAGAGGQQHRFDLLATQADGEGLGLRGSGERVDHPRTASGGLGEQAEGPHGLAKEALGALRREAREWIGAEVRGAEAVRRGTDVLGALGDVAPGAINGGGGVVANRHGVEHAAT